MLACAACVLDQILDVSLFSVHARVCSSLEVDCGAENWSVFPFSGQINQNERKASTYSCQATLSAYRGKLNTSLATFCFVIISQFLPLQFLTDRFDVVSTRNTAQVCTVWFQSVSRVDFTNNSHYIGVPDSRIVSPVPHSGGGSQQPSDAVFLPWTWSNKCKIQVWELLCDLSDSIVAPFSFSFNPSFLPFSLPPSLPPSLQVADTGCEALTRESHLWCSRKNTTAREDLQHYPWLLLVSVSNSICLWCFYYRQCTWLYLWWVKVWFTSV